MKSLLKKVAKACWGATGPIRHPITRRLHAKLRVIAREGVRDEVEPRYAEVTDAIRGLATSSSDQTKLLHAIKYAADDHDLALTGLIREVARLRRRLESLEARVGDEPVVRAHDSAY